MKTSKKVIKYSTLTSQKTQYIDCNNCAMQAVCLPIGEKEQAIDLTSNYLKRRIDVPLKKQLSNQITQATNSKLFEQGKPLKAIFSVCSGTFKLSYLNTAGIEQVIGFRFPGEIMAEDALFLESYNYSATALGASSVCAVFTAPLSACSALAPELQNNLLQLLTKQSYQQQLNNQSLTGRSSAESLLAAFLVNVYQRNVKHSNNSTEIALAISRHDMANFLGIRRETLSRLLSKFQQEKLIKSEGKKLSLLALERLTQLASD